MLARLNGLETFNLSIPRASVEFVAPETVKGSFASTELPTAAASKGDDASIGMFEFTFALSGS